MKNRLENIDEVFKQAFDGFEANVDPSVWTNVQSSIAGGTPPPTDPVSTTIGSAATKAVALKIAAVVIAVGTIATATYYVVTSPQKEEVAVINTPIVEETITEAPLEKIEPVEIKVETSTTISNTHDIVINDDFVEEKKENKQKKANIDLMDKAAANKPDLPNTVKKDESNNSASTPNNKENDSPVAKSPEKPVVEKSEDTPNEKPEIKEIPEIETKKSILITEPIPNVFTPNGDGQNDVIKIKGENIDKMEVAIMDKTGKVLYWLRSVEDEWEGKDMGGYDLPPGMYYMAGSVKDKEGNSQIIKQAINLLK